MTTKQRIALMAQWWPEACRAQGWRVNDRALRLRVLSDAVGRPITSANQLNTKADVDSVIAHLGMLKDNVALTIETDHPEIGAARPLRFVIGEWQLKCLAVYMGHDGAQKYLAEIIRDKFRHASRVMPLTIEQLDAAPVIRRNKAGELYESPSQLDQVLMKLASAIQSRRKAAGDSTHDMKLKAGVECDCATYCKNKAGIQPQPEGFFCIGDVQASFPQHQGPVLHGTFKDFPDHRPYPIPQIVRV